jgi:hypothetical protein
VRHRRPAIVSCFKECATTISVSEYSLASSVILRLRKGINSTLSLFEHIHLCFMEVLVLKLSLLLFLIIHSLPLSLTHEVYIVIFHLSILTPIDSLNSFSPDSLWLLHIDYPSVLLVIISQNVETSLMFFLEPHVRYLVHLHLIVPCLI